MANRQYSEATALILRKVAERRAYERADAFMGKCAEAFMTKNASDWTLLRDALAYSELEKEAGLGKQIGMMALVPSLLFGGGRGAQAAQMGAEALSRSAPVVQQVVQTADKAVKAAPVIQKAAPVIQKAAPAAVRAAPKQVVRQAASATAPRAALPPPSPNPASGAKKSNWGKLLAGLGIGTAAGGGATYAMTRNNATQPPPPPPSAGEQILALLGRGKQWIQDNPGTAAGIGAGALALGGLGYALGSRG